MAGYKIINKNQCHFGALTKLTEKEDTRITLENIKSLGIA